MFVNSHYVNAEADYRREQLKKLYPSKTRGSGEARSERPEKGSRARPLVLRKVWSA